MKLGHRIVIACAACLCLVKHGSRVGERGPAAEGAPPAASGLAGYGCWEPGGIPVWSEPGFFQSYTALDFRTVEVTDERRGDTPGRRTHAADASFLLLDIASARKDLFACAGFADDGAFVLERWELRPALLQGIGPGGVARTVEALDGDGMVIKEFVQTRIYQGALAPKLLGLDFDAEARFMLALLANEGGSVLCRFDNVPGALPVPLLCSSAVPELAAMRYVEKFDHALLGRVWKLEDPFASERSILLVDGDNDGRFEGPPLSGDQAFFEAQGLARFELWDSLRRP